MQRVCITIDVEDFFLPRPPFDTVFARKGTQEWGIGLMMDILEQNGAKGTFFIDVYNRTTLNTALLAEACQMVVSRGHELGLHTHPDFPKGVRGYGMQQVMARYPLDEQCQLVEQGVNVIEKWTGIRPRTHRAGGYGANRDTLRALWEAGITTDSSLYPGYPGCPLAQDYPSVNVCFEAEGICEIPVTVTRNYFGIPLPNGRWLGPQLTMKIDLDWLDLPALQSQINVALQLDSAPVILFLHSYSFLNLNRGLIPHEENVDKFRKILAWLSVRHDVAMTSLDEAASHAVTKVLPASRLPECRFNISKQPWRWFRFLLAELSVARLKLLLASMGAEK